MIAQGEERTLGRVPPPPTKPGGRPAGRAHVSEERCRPYVFMHTSLSHPTPVLAFSWSLFVSAAFGRISEITRTGEGDVALRAPDVRGGGYVTQGSFLTLGYHGSPSGL
jgi:hypothetical protein